MNRKEAVQLAWSRFIAYDVKSGTYKSGKTRWLITFFVLMILPPFLGVFATLLPQIAGKGEVPKLQALTAHADNFWYVLAFVISVLAAAIIALEKFLGGNNDEAEEEKNWLSSRASAEAIKSQLYLFAMRADVYDCEDALGVRKLQEQILAIEQANALDLIQFDSSTSVYASKDISTWDEMTFDQYLQERLNDQLNYYERKIAEKEALVKAAKRTMRIAGIISALIAVVGAYFNLSILISLISIVGMAIQYFHEKLKYKEELTKYHAAHKQLKLALLRRGLVSDKELVSICEQTFRAENGSWQQLWLANTK